jgi:hypothetical protein
MCRLSALAPEVRREMLFLLTRGGVPTFREERNGLTFMSFGTV